MPTYDYRCRDCGHTIEIIHSILDDGPEVCERCRGPMQRVLHPAGVIFRGSGFYVTDTRSSSAGEGSSGRPGDGAGADSTPGAGGDSAPAGSAGGTGKD